MIFIIALVTLAACIYWYFTQHFDYFIKQGIPGPKPVPIFGNYWGTWNKLFHETMLDNQKKYGKIYGLFDGRTPNLVVADPELLKKVFIKDFDLFMNRRDFFPANEYLPHNVGGLKGQKWKAVRNAMSPSFSSAKIKKIAEPLEECAEGLVAFVEDLVKSSGEVNLKEITTGYTLDVITSCALGTKLPSLRNLDDPFVSKALKVVQGDSTKLENLMFLFPTLYPQLSKLIPATGFSEMDFFVEASKQILQEKRQNMSSDGKNNILEFLIQESKNESSPFQNEIVLFAQVLGFMLAGFDTPATVMSTILHCLGVNQDVQTRLRNEIRQAIEKYGGITHECVQDLPYLDRCISESMRLYPANSKTDRVCSKTVVYDNITIKEGTLVTLPIYAIHHDPEIYPEPFKFDPERFSTEEKAKRDPLNFVPFGLGPRGCIGKRFGMEEMKIGITHLIHNFRFYPCKNTNDPPVFLKGMYTFTALVAPNLCMGVEKLQV